MSVFAYDPEKVRAWSNSVVEFLNGGYESIRECSNKFNEQVEALVQPNVWTGAAAAQNYQNFLDTHNAMVNFINNFGSSFEQAMNKVNANVAELEVSNLGADTNVSNSFGSLTYDQLQSMSEENINKNVVRYDYAVISKIGQELNKILSTLKDTSTKLESKIDELNNGSSMWDGNAAETAKETLTNVLKTNMNVVFETLNICISNISAAAEAAQNADRA